MGLDPTKKAALEKRVVLGLVSVLAVVLIVSLRPMLRGQSISNLASTATSKVALPDTLKVLHDRMLTAIDTQQSKVTVELPKPEPLYAAFDYRDPFESLLPDIAGATTATGQQVSLDSVDPAAGAIPFPEVKIGGIVWGGPKPLAIIKGQLNMVGDVVEGAKITTIDRHGVTIEFNGATTVVLPDRDVPGAGSRSASGAARTAGGSGEWR